MEKFFGLFKKQSGEDVKKEDYVIELLDKDSMMDRYFFRMNQAIREETFEYVYSQKAETENQEFFFNEIKNSRKELTYDYCLPTIEPCIINERIWYANGKKVAFGRKLGEWRELANNFYPEFHSRLVLPAELFLFYAYRMAQDKWDKHYVCEDSSNAGNFWDSPHSRHNFETAGKREVAGFADGIGNTTKICYKSGIYYICGGHCGKSGNWSVAGHIDLCKDSSVEYRYASPVVAVL